MTFVISAAVIALMSLLLGYVVHVLLLGPDYAQLAAIFRTPADGEAHFPFMLVAHLFIGIGFTWIYRQGREAKPFVAQGVRFGIAVAVLTTIPTYVIYYAIQPMPGMVVAKQIVFDTVSMMLMGIVAAWINRRDGPRGAT